jgi:hypothetical protein
MKPPGAFLSGPTMSSPHTAKGQVRGMVWSAYVGRCVCRAWNWQPSQIRMMFLASATEVGQ